MESRHECFNGERQGEGKRKRRGAWQEVCVYDPSTWEVGAGTHVRFFSKEGKKKGGKKRKWLVYQEKAENI